MAQEKKRSNKVTVWISNEQFKVIEDLKQLTGETSVSLLIRQALDELHKKLSN